MKIADNKTFTMGTDLNVNRMGYGAMRITGKGVWGQPERREEAIKVLRSLPELGVNFIDTADSYGPYVSEELIAEALYPYPAGMVIATKGGFMRTGPNEWHINSSPEHLEEALAGSLKRLKVEQIDLYQLHRRDPKVPFEKTLEFLQQAQKEGKIKHIGLSEVSIADIKMAQEYVNVVSVQNKYSVMHRQWEDVLEYCGQNNMAFIPWNPINAGNVANMDLLQKIADIHRTTPHEVALTWLYHHAPNILLIPGTSSLKHLKDNVKSIDIKLTEEEMTQLGQMSA